MRTPLFALVVLSIAACMHRSAPAAARVERARAELHDESGKRVGDATLQQTPNGVVLVADLMGLPAGTHALHLHMTGKCEPPFSSAGGHFNPGNRQHGFRSSEGYHAGDLPNVHVPSSGSLRAEYFIPDLVIQGDNGLLDQDGASVVIHAFADDYASDPAGAAGARIACGVIER